MASDGYHFGIIGMGHDAIIAAYGSSVAMGIPSDDSAPKAWTCEMCTFHNTETLGRFCSMCGSARIGNSNVDDTGGPVSGQQKRGSEVSEYSHNEHNDILGELPLHSNGRANNLEGSFSLLSPRRTSNREGSFSFLSLMDSNPPFGEDPEKRNPQEIHPTLSEKDFQMSFANWSISDNGAWTCIACTYVNTNVLHLTCEVCGQDRPSKNSGAQSQKAMQEMFETSFRTGQQDFLRRQQEKIDEVEQRVLSNERVEEIMGMQSEMIQEFKDEKEEANYQAGAQNSDRLTIISERAQRAGEWVEQLEQVHRLEEKEQQRMEQVLSQRWRDLGMERMSTQPCLQNSAISSRNLGPAPAAENQVRAQEQLLSQWKKKTRARDLNITAIRERQQAIFDKLQGGL